MESIHIWGSFHNGGDGSVYIVWFLTEEDAELDQDKLEEGWGETCTEEIETFVGSKTYNKALENSNNLKMKYGKRLL